MAQGEYRIALMIDTSYRYGRDTLSGILSCSRHPYAMDLEWFTSTRLAALTKGRFDGLLLHLHGNSAEKRLCSLGIPTVNVGNADARMAADVPRVASDHEAIGVMAGRYFLQRGFRNFGYSHFGATAFSQERCRGFARTIEAAGAPALSIDSEPPGWVYQRQVTTFEAQRQWLISLPKPVAILAANDAVGAQLLRSCVQAHLKVPEDVAVLGVGNDETSCLISGIALSSVEEQAIQIGRQAMMLLKVLLAGGRAPEKPVLLPPVRVVERHSSDELAFADGDVAAAVRFIRDHLAESIDVDQIARATMMSRRRLEVKFRAALQRSPAEEIRRVRFEQASRMLLETEMTIVAIARQVGLNQATQLFAAFQQECGMTPSEYRKQHRVESSASPAAD
jgi:LacI family transcriptional regulator